MSDPKDQQVAGIYRAIALRFYSRVDARDYAEGHGGDLSGFGSRSTPRDADERYAAAVEDMIGETPDSADAALALVEFAGILAADRFVGRDHPGAGQRRAGRLSPIARPGRRGAMDQ